MSQEPKGAVRIYRKPRLKRPVLVAAWPGIGNVALRAASYLRQKLGAEAFGEIAPMPFFEPGGVFIEEDVIQPLRFPQSKFYFWRNPGSGSDIIIFEAETQPSTRGYEFAGMVLDAAQRLGVRQVYTFAAALVQTLVESPRVWAAAASQEKVEELKKYGVVLKGDFYIAGLNGLCLGLAQERGMEAICLLGETIRYFPQVENPAASYAVLEVLTRVLGIEIDFTELMEEARQARRELERLVMESRRQYIDRFTVPLWEQEPGPEEGGG
jgi:hypothetical protein